MQQQAFVNPVTVRGLSSLTRPQVCVRHNTLRYVTRRVRSASFHRVAMQQEATQITYTTQGAGKEQTDEYRLFYKSSSNDLISPWHDIPIYPNPSDKSIVNYVNEIPRGTNAKMEIATDEANTPIKQDIKKGKLRFYQYGPSLVNYGAIPQTWEDPGSLNKELNVGGDGDPVDVTEIGSKVMPFGAVYKVKVLGCLALLDEGEIDWKIIGINVNDPLADQVNDIDDVEKVIPQKVARVREWFKMYKTAEGKGENEYAYNGEAKGKDFAMKIIEETYQSWKDLKSGKIANDDELSLK